MILESNPRVAGCVDLGQFEKLKEMRENQEIQEMRQVLVRKSHEIAEPKTEGVRSSLRTPLKEFQGHLAYRVCWAQGSYLPRLRQTTEKLQEEPGTGSPLQRGRDDGAYRGDWDDDE